MRSGPLVGGPGSRLVRARTAASGPIRTRLSAGVLVPSGARPEARLVPAGPSPSGPIVGRSVSLRAVLPGTAAIDAAEPAARSVPAVPVPVAVPVIAAVIAAVAAAAAVLVMPVTVPAVAVRAGPVAAGGDAGTAAGTAAGIAAGGDAGVAGTGLLTRIRLIAGTGLLHGTGPVPIAGAGVVRRAGRGSAAPAVIVVAGRWSRVGLGRLHVILPGPVHPPVVLGPGSLPPVRRAAAALAPGYRAGHRPGRHPGGRLGLLTRRRWRRRRRRRRRRRERGLDRAGRLDDGRRGREGTPGSLAVDGDPATDRQPQDRAPAHGGGERGGHHQAVPAPPAVGGPPRGSHPGIVSESECVNTFRRLRRMESPRTE